MSQDDIETDPILARLEEGREKLGGFGEPVWSQAMMQYRLNIARLHAAEKQTTALFKFNDELRDRLHADKAALEAELDRLREERNALVRFVEHVIAHSEHVDVVPLTANDYERARQLVKEER